MYPQSNGENILSGVKEKTLNLAFQVQGGVLERKDFQTVTYWLEICRKKMCSVT